MITRQPLLGILEVEIGILCTQQERAASVSIRKLNIYRRVMLLNRNRLKRNCNWLIVVLHGGGDKVSVLKGSAKLFWDWKFDNVIRIFGMWTNNVDCSAL